MKRVIFVTGGTGYIGSHVVKELREKGYRLGLKGLSISFRVLSSTGYITAR